MTERIQLINWVTFRLILPFTLLAACIFRFNLFTLIYGLFFLLVPLARSPNVYTIKRHTGGLIWALTTVSGIFMLAQIAFQIALAARKPYGHEFPNCGMPSRRTSRSGKRKLEDSLVGKAHCDGSSAKSSNGHFGDSDVPSTSAGQPKRRSMRSSAGKRFPVTFKTSLTTDSEDDVDQSSNAALDVQDDSLVVETPQAVERMRVGKRIVSGKKRVLGTLRKMRKNEDDAEELTKLLRAKRAHFKAKSDAMEKKTKSLNKLQQRVKKAKAAMSKVQAELKVERRLIKGTSMEMELIKTEIQTKKQAVEALRFWADRISFGDLPNEVESLVLEMLDFFHRFRVRRVCRRWNFLLSAPVITSHAFLDLTVATAANRRIYRSRVYYLNKMGDGLAEQVFPRIHALTFLCSGTTSSDSYFVRAFGARCTGVTSVTIANLLIDVQSLFDFFSPILQKTPVALRNVFVTALPPPLYAAWPMTLKRIVNDWYVRLPSSVIIATWEELTAIVDRLVWPFPQSQLEWLAKYAPALNAYPDVIEWLEERGEYSHYANLISFERRQIVCSNHKHFCDSLPLSVYQELPGSIRCLIALCILQLPTPDLQPPPVEFVFEKYLYTKHRKTIPPRVDDAHCRHGIVALTL
ncbi:hypothetical protein BV898_04668 [Hypsibius exemplaris]|uniref:F-box domain-containing protein n=1 Tax=Hypsibius exemplaris TaxID=2072580 RepID=A0A1W0X211_HYPEX|nr:hypothetical protein BV898_04668 [Hypsibius exemplaris]